jgi:hypothetical protein
MFEAIARATTSYKLQSAPLTESGSECENRKNLLRFGAVLKPDTSLADASGLIIPG